MFTILFERAWEIIQENRRAYIALNILFYGLVMASMCYAAVDQPLQTQRLLNGNNITVSGTISFIGKGYGAGQIFQSLLTIYFGNLLGAAFGNISFPSFIIPFSGLLIGASRAVEWGLLLSPANPDLRIPLLLHLPTLVIEGQAYILAMLGAYIHGRALIWPQTVGLKSRWQAYVEGIRQTGTLYAPIMVLLAVAAIYGVVEVLVR